MEELVQEKERLKGLADEQSHGKALEDVSCIRSEREVFVTCLGRGQVLCSCWWDGAPSQSPL